MISVPYTELKKPKTPEEELRDELISLASNHFNDNRYDLTHNSYYLVSALMDNYNITKSAGVNHGLRNQI